MISYKIFKNFIAEEFELYTFHTNHPNPIDFNKDYYSKNVRININNIK